MFSKRLAFLPIVALIALAALPSGASANTGSVKCEAPVSCSVQRELRPRAVSTETGT
jgi:hypothetical protein